MVKGSSAFQAFDCTSRAFRCSVLSGAARKIKNVIVQVSAFDAVFPGAADHRMRLSGNREGIS